VQFENASLLEADQQAKKYYSKLDPK